MEPLTRRMRSTVTEPHKLPSPLRGGIEGGGRAVGSARQPNIARKPSLLGPPSLLFGRHLIANRWRFALGRLGSLPLARRLLLVLEPLALFSFEVVVWLACHWPDLVPGTGAYLVPSEREHKRAPQEVV